MSAVIKLMLSSSSLHHANHLASLQLQHEAIQTACATQLRLFPTRPETKRIVGLVRIEDNALVIIHISTIFVVKPLRRHRSWMCMKQHVEQ
jgi:hypothetical protein